MPILKPDDRREYFREYARRNREKYAEHTRKWREQNPRYFSQQQGYHRKRHERLSKIIATAKDRPCHDCGIKYPPYVMDFDHVRGTKLFNVSRRSKGMVEEMKKCEVVCANCHRERTHRRKINSMN